MIKSSSLCLNREAKAYKKKKKVFPYSLAVTKGILVSFYFCAALTDMFKFSAYPYLN